MIYESILLIEDDLNLRQSLALILRRAEYSVTATHCVFTALDMLKSGNYYLVIADINVPEIRNVFFPKIQHSYRSLPCVILTDQPVMDLETKQNSPRHQFLVKPGAPEKLLDCVREVLRKKSSPNHNYLHHDPVSRL